jgi:membrane protein implicated in regulation of membrane protease activity
MERMTLECQIRDMLIGKVFALIFVLGVLAVAGYAISQGQAVLAGVLGTAVVCSVVWALVRVLGETDAQDRNQKPS